VANAVPDLLKLIVTAPFAIAGDGEVVIWAKLTTVTNKNNKVIFFMSNVFN
jgi:hypothetical protein